MENSNNSTLIEVQNLLNSGQFDHAVSKARDVLSQDPDNIFCLSVVAQSDFNQGNLEQAKETLCHAHSLEPGEVNVNRSLGLICNRQGLFEESKNYLLSTLKLNKENPETLLDAMLMGISLAKLSEEKAAKVIAWVFSQSPQLKFAYEHQQAPPMIKEASTIANTILRDWNYQYQKNEINHLCLGFSDEESARVYEFLDVFHGFKPKKNVHPLQNPTYHAFNGIDSQPFYNSKDFDWSEELAEKSESIKQELLKLFDDEDLVKPYIDGQATNYQGLNELANSLNWSSVHLIKGGKRNEELLAQCPITQSSLQKLPLPELEGNGPEVFLSVLKPGAVIKPHHGLSNIKLTVHLGLDIPEGDVEIKVGEETTAWKNGELVIFDDTFEHSAWNKTEENRAVLIFEVWHPDLSKLERNAIQKIQSLHSQFYAETSELTVDEVIDLSASA